jgi:predicted ester cyclase
MPLILLSLIAVALLSGCATQKSANEELAEQNKALVLRFLNEVYNKDNLAVADEVIAEKYVSHNQLAIEVLGPEGIKNAARMQRAAFPDQASIIEDMIAEGDKVVVRGKDTGTHSGAAFMGIPAKGNKFTITWIDIFRIENGKLVEAWLEIDVERFRKQLLGE